MLLLLLLLLLSSQTSSTRTVSFDQHTPFSGEGKFADSSGEVSIASYFQKKSNAMGDIVTDRLSPNQRVSELL